jgi:uncharacterized protein YacL
MAEETKAEKKISAAEIKGTISTSLATAFGFVIGLLWNNVVVGGLAVAGVPLTGTTFGGWILLMVTAVIITVVMVVLIILISRWGSKKQ